MKYYTIESHCEKEAPFGIAWQVKLFDEHTLLKEYNHIFYNEIAGYCKCLEDMGFIAEDSMGKSLLDTIKAHGSLKNNEPKIEYTSTTVSNIPAENYEMLTVLCNGTYMNIKGHVQIVYDSNTPYIEYKSTSIVNADSVIIHAQKGQIKNNGVSTVR